MNVTSIDEKAIFNAARMIGAADARDAYLSRSCAGDTELEARIRAQLRAYEESPSFLESPLAHVAKPTLAMTVVHPFVEALGTSIGPYKLREVLGEGGMGIVYAAEQEQPIRRRVALKVIKPGMDSKEIIGRFSAERQALALMDHPNIAKVLDAGTTESGRPYFVMEFVRGLPITEYCDRAKLSLRDRLKLFITVCQAIQHAHQKGIIHRDLKPSNVMITLHDGTPVPKVIDFGVAKALNQRLTEQTVYTRAASLVGTPMYMSPEQAELSGLDVDTRSDVYALGTLLYELLTGQTPFDKARLSKAGYDELRRIIREDEPPRPSQRINTLTASDSTTVSTQRGIDARKLQSTLHGELDWIVMKALEKDRNRRYESASAFAADVERFLNDEPVEACPPTTYYRLAKLVHRNRAALVTASTLVFALVAGTITSIWQATEASRARHSAVESLAETKQVLRRETEALREMNRQRDVAQVERLKAEINLRVALRGYDEADLRTFQMSENRDPAPERQAVGLTAESFRSAIATLRERASNTSSHANRNSPDSYLDALDDSFIAEFELAINHASFAIWLAKSGRPADAAVELQHSIEVADRAFASMEQIRPSDRVNRDEYRYIYTRHRHSLNIAMFHLMKAQGQNYSSTFFSAPLGMCVDMQGGLLISGRRLGRIMRFDLKTGEYLENLPAVVPSPHGLTIGPNGNIFVACEYADQICEVSGTTGEIVREFVAAIDKPIGLAFGADRNLYVTSYNSHCVMRYDGDTGDLIDEFIATGSGGLLHPAGLAFGPEGDLFVASPGLRAVCRFDGTTGAFLDILAFGGGMTFPVALAFGPDNKLYVVDRDSDTVFQCDGMSGKKIREIGGPELLMPEALVFGSNGHLYVSSGITSCICEYESSSGELAAIHHQFDFTTLSGNGEKLAPATKSLR